MAEDAALQPLAQNFAIVDANGFPTQYFIKWAQQRQIDIQGGITAAQAQQLIDDWAAQREIIAGVALHGGGDLSADRTIDHDDSLVVPGTYGTATKVARIVVDAQGHIQGVTEVTISGGGGGGGSVGPHTYWRMIGHAFDNRYLTCADCIMADTPGGPQVATGGTALASGYYGGNVPANAFDGSGGTLWEGNGGADSSPDHIWLGYQFPAPVELKEVRWGTDTTYFHPSESLQAGRVEYSDDGAVWLTAWGVGVSDWTPLGGGVAYAIFTQPGA